MLRRPWLHSGNVEEFAKAARRNVAPLAAEVRAGRDVIVAQPTCAYVLKRDYPIHLARHRSGGRAHVRSGRVSGEAASRRGRPFDLRDEFPGRDDGRGARHRHLPRGLPPPGPERRVRFRDLLKLAGVKCALVQKCSGIDGTWGYRAENYEWRARWRRPMAERSKQPATRWCAATAISPTAPSCRRPGRCPCTRCS